MPQCLPREKREAEVGELGWKDQLSWLCQEAISTWKWAKGTQISPGRSSSCWLLQRNQLSFPQGSTTRWIKIASQWFLPAWQCIFLFARAPQGRKVLVSQNTDGSHHQISAGALERPIWQGGKGSSIFLKVLLLLIRTVKQTRHQDKEELTFLGY